jgi:hypothetical protein
MEGPCLELRESFLQAREKSKIPETKIPAEIRRIFDVESIDKVILQ